MEDEPTRPPAPAESSPAGEGARPPRRRRGGRDRERGPRPEGETGAVVTEGAAAEPQDWKPGEGSGSGNSARPPRPEGSGGRRDRGPRREGGGDRPPRPEGEAGARPPRAEGEGSRREGGDRGPRQDRDRGGRDDRGRGGRDGGGRGGRGERDRDRGPRQDRPRDDAPKPKPAETPKVPAKPIDFLAELGGPLLESVSRSFFLTIKLLPEALRTQISLGYLLARTSDSIADAAVAAPAQTRLEHLRAFSEMIKYGGDAELLNGLKKEITTRLPAGDEHTLLEAAPRILAWLDSMSRADQWEIRRVLGRITHGQELDLIRFGDGGVFKALANRDELLDYTYFVAGSVGEFWTRLCALHLGENFTTLTVADMLPLGRRYGQGLQLINVLRDLPEDLAAGRCYLPLDEITAAGLEPDDLLSNPSRARALVAHWRAEAIACLDDGWKYVQGIREWKLRYAVALPILIGLDTLALLASNPPLEQKGKVKVKRSATAATLLKAKLGVISQAWLNGMYSRRRKRAAA